MVDKPGKNEPHISPVPGCGKVMIDLPGEPADWIISIFSTQGVPMKRIESKQTNKVEVDVSHFPPGTYICRTILPGHALYSIKLVISAHT